MWRPGSLFENVVMVPVTLVACCCVYLYLRGMIMRLEVGSGWSVLHGFAHCGKGAWHVCRIVWEGLIPQSLTPTLVARALP